LAGSCGMTAGVNWSASEGTPVGSHVRPPIALAKTWLLYNHSDLHHRGTLWQTECACSRATLSETNY